MANPIHLLISSVGRRIGLMNCFRESMQELDLRGSVYGADCSTSAPGFHMADRSWVVPRCVDPDFDAAIARLARAEGIRVIVPTIDTELHAMARLRPHLLREGIWTAISDPETVAICADKVLTNRWLREHGFPTVRQAPLASVQASPTGWRFPAIVKPRVGSASVGVRRVSNETELQSVCDPAGNLVIEELAPGREHTVNIYIDRGGRCRCAVPHERLEVRSGEVSKAITVRHRGMMELASRVGEALPGARGALNLQCFLEDSGGIRIIEINARFGGGYPLAHRAGAPFTQWLLQEALDCGPISDCDDWQGGIVMLRYDEAVFATASELPGAVCRSS